MGILHSRFASVVFLQEPPKEPSSSFPFIHHGAFTQCSLNDLKELNHHFASYRCDAEMLHKTHNTKLREEKEKEKE
jgi:hypothetical protein